MLHLVHQIVANFVRQCYCWTHLPTVAEKDESIKMNWNCDAVGPKTRKEKLQSWMIIVSAASICVQYRHLIHCKYKSMYVCVYGCMYVCIYMYVCHVFFMFYVKKKKKELKHCLQTFFQVLALLCQNFFAGSSVNYFYYLRCFIDTSKGDTGIFCSVVLRVSYLHFIGFQDSG